jgi:hypothetical protein
MVWTYTTAPYLGTEEPMCRGGAMAIMACTAAHVLLHDRVRVHFLSGCVAKINARDRDRDRDSVTLR